MEINLIICQIYGLTESRACASMIAKGLIVANFETITRPGPIGKPILQQI